MNNNKNIKENWILQIAMKLQKMNMILSNVHMKLNKLIQIIVQNIVLKIMELLEE